MGLLDRARSLLRRARGARAEPSADAGADTTTDAAPGRPERQIVGPRGGHRDQPRKTAAELLDEPAPGPPARPGRATDRGDEARSLTDDEFTRAVPRGVQIASAWAWRILVLAAAFALLGWLITKLSVITIPVGVGLLLAAGLSPVKNIFLKWGWPSGLAAAVCLLGGVIVVFGVLTLIISQVVEQSDELANQTVAGVTEFSDWVTRSPIGVSADQLNQWQDQGLAWLTNWAGRSQALIAQYSLQAGTYLGNFLTGAAMALFAVFFLLYDGRTIWSFALRFVPRAGRGAADRAGLAGWRALTEYVKATVAVAAVDAFFPLVAALIMRVPLAWALGGLIFLGAFIPIVGVVLTGAVAVFVTLVTQGPIHALVMLGVIILVNQLEGNILQPMLLGRAVALHPLAVLLSIAVGISMAGIIGGLLVVPVLAFLKAFIDALGDASPPGSGPGEESASDAGSDTPVTADAAPGDADEPGLSPA